jgi:hypothetical protein
MRDPSLVLIPPRPQFGGWVLSGASAGAVLGLVELAFVFLGGHSPPPTLSMLVIAAEVLAVAVGAGLLGWVLLACAKPPSHSYMVGALVGPLLATSIAGIACSRAIGGDAPSALEVSGLMAALSLAVAAALTAARIGDRLERSGATVSGPLVWLAAALPLACAERVFQTNTDHDLAIAALGGVLVAAIASIAGALEWTLKRSSRPRMAHSRVFTLLIAGAIAAAFAPRALPWVLVDRDMPPVTDCPSNILVVALDSVDPASAVNAELASLTWPAVTYDALDPQDLPGVRSVLTTPDGSRVVSELVADGYAAGAMLAADSVIPELEGAQLDTTPGPGGLLAGPLRWTAGAGLLTGPGDPLLRVMAFDAAHRSPDQIAIAATRWLFSWRVRRAPSPFFLFVDLRVGRRGRADTAERGLGVLMNQLDQLGVLDRTTVLAVREVPPRSSAALSAPMLRAVLRPPLSRPDLPLGVHGAGWTRGTDLGNALLQIGRADCKSKLAPPDPARPLVRAP